MVSRVKDYIRSAETKRIIFSIIILALYSVVLCFFNSNIEKTPLINSEGKTYAKAEVVELSLIHI